MKPKYSGYEARKSSGFVELPPAGAYIGKIINVKVDKSYDKSHDQLVLMLDITEGEYAGRYMEVYNDQKERFPDCKYRGTLRITVPEENEPESNAWMKSFFEGAMWAVEQSNDGYGWDWDETKLKGKDVGFSVRNSFYTNDNGQNKATTEIGRLESVEEVREGKVRPMKDRDNRTNKTEGETMDTSTLTDVTSEVEVPF